MTGEGWHFDADTRGSTEDSVNGCNFIRELYFADEKDYKGRFTVPVLYDKQEKKIVNNESSEIIRYMQGIITSVNYGLMSRMLNSEFNDFGENNSVDYYPEDKRKEIDQLNTWIYE